MKVKIRRVVNRFEATPAELAADYKFRGLDKYQAWDRFINETRHCQNKTEALYQMRQPWVWCDGCAQIHFHTEWQNQLHHGVEDKNYD